MAARAPLTYTNGQGFPKTGIGMKEEFYRNSRSLKIDFHLGRSLNCLHFRPLGSTCNQLVQNVKFPAWRGGGAGRDLPRPPSPLRRCRLARLLLWYGSNFHLRAPAAGFKARRVTSLRLHGDTSAGSQMSSQASRHLGFQCNFLGSTSEMLDNGVTFRLLAAKLAAKGS